MVTGPARRQPVLRSQVRAPGSGDSSSSLRTADTEDILILRLASLWTQSESACWVFLGKQLIYRVPNYQLNILVPERPTGTISV